MITQDHYKELLVKCPICGSELYGTMYSEEASGAMHICEVHAYCPKCTYREEMCYSEPAKFICETDTIENKEKAKRLRINIISEKEYDLI